MKLVELNVKEMRRKLREMIDWRKDKDEEKNSSREDSKVLERLPKTRLLLQSRQEQILWKTFHYEFKKHWRLSFAMISHTLAQNIQATSYDTPSLSTSP